jgi:1-acyl-sn-glycerol-3-phosphate acyltransferase
MMRIARTPVVVMKRELSTLPGFGWATLTLWRHPRRPRTPGAKALREMLGCGQGGGSSGTSGPHLSLRDTRVRTGETPPLQAGFAGLYKALGLPVVPSAVDSGRLLGPQLPPAAAERFAF